MLKNYLSNKEDDQEPGNTHIDTRYSSYSPPWLNISLFSQASSLTLSQEIFMFGHCNTAVQLQIIPNFPYFQNPCLKTEESQKEPDLTSRVNDLYTQILNSSKIQCLASPVSRCIVLQIKTKKNLSMALLPF